MTEQDLIEKLRRIAALYAGATTVGERAAALRAHERVSTRLDQQRRVQRTEYRFTMADGFQRRLFIALARKHGLEPFRYKRQRRTTVMLRVTPQFVDDVLWPEFERLSDTLVAYLDEVTERVIAAAVHEDQSDAALSPELPLG